MTMNIQDRGFGLSPFILMPLATVSLIFIGGLLKIVYNLTLHPLSKYPGPKLWAVSRIPYAMMVLRGQAHKDILALHEYYDAEVIRIAPNELSFQHPDAMKDIMGHRKGQVAENAKDPDFTEPHNLDIISANRENHTRYRRVLSKGFSAKTMQEQQPIIKGFIDLLIQRLHEVSGQNPVDMVSWYNYTTFDIIGDLAFGDSFGCLANSDYHPWVKAIFTNIKMDAMFSLARSFKILEPLLRAFIPKSLIEVGMSHKLFVRNKVDQRLAINTPRPDFIEMMAKNEAQAMNKEEIYGNADILVLAGSETTATALSGCTYHLTTNPDKLAKLTQEVRNSFQHEDEIDLLSTAKLEYLGAVLEETLRAYPPVAVAIPRKTPPEGAEVIGQWIPGNTTIGVAHWALYHNEKFFSKPFEFHPERWLGDPAFGNDRLDALQPFHTGPRNCLGMNLAYAEMKMILAKVIWNFDLQLASQSRYWVNQNVYTIYDKQPLMVYLTPAKV